jgi:Domain of unknown function (DUF4439)
MSVAAAWQAALAAEQQAVFGYALLGPRLTAPADVALARSCQDAHEQLQKSTSAALVRVRLTPVPPPADYPALHPVPDARVARHLAVRLETDAAVAWRFLYAQAAAAHSPAAEFAALRPSIRRQAQDALTGSAVRAAQWRGAPVPFPGI